MEALEGASIQSGYLRAGDRRQMMYCLLMPTQLLRFSDKDLCKSRGHIDLDALDGVEAQQKSSRSQPYVLISALDRPHMVPPETAVPPVPSAQFYIQ